MLPLLCLRQARAMCQPCVSSAPVHGLAAKRRVALEVGDHHLGGGLPFGRDLREHPAGGGEGDEHEHDQDFHGEAP